MNIIKRAAINISIRLTDFAYALMHWKAYSRQSEVETMLLIDYADRYFVFTAETDGLYLQHWPGKDDGVPLPNQEVDE